ncbi:MAG: 16S rRNA (cytidine(1402)-2'-O)-methyltransferase [Gemmatimonadota bacterium]
MNRGTLFVVATPLGNLGDLSPRAAEVLRTVHVVAAEDTRESRKLLDHVGARVRLTSYHAHSADGKREEILAALAGGKDVALVSDAGTPTVSDPGADLIRDALDAGSRVIPIPGPSAVTTALSGSGLPADRYLFLGFLPRKGVERDEWLGRALASPVTVVVFEAPGRVASLLEDWQALGGGARRAVVARELTKIYEEFRFGTVDELIGKLEEVPPRGECTVVLESAPVADKADAVDPRISQVVRVLRAQGVERRTIAQVLSEGFEMPRNEAYRISIGEDE